MCAIEINILPLVLKARHLGGSAFSTSPLGLGLVVVDGPSKLSCVKKDLPVGDS